jgi:sirohydrochlorin cobaltochelatase
MMECDAIVIVGHGSKDPDGTAEILGLAGLVQDMLERPIPVEVGFLELSHPPAVEVIREVVQAGARQIAIVPLMLNSAGHARSDVPAVVLTARAEFPEVSFVYAEPLADDYSLLALARDSIRDAGGLGKPLAVFFRGASEPSANAEAYKTARLLAELTQAPRVSIGFSGITWPSIPDALAELASPGTEAIASFSWFLATGVLLRRIDDALQHERTERGIHVHHGGYLGVGTEVAALVIQRVNAAQEGITRTPCDVCSYRRPFPSTMAHLDAPRGVGHSHLAADHLHGDHQH